MSKAKREETNLLSESDDYRDDGQITSQQNVYSEDEDHYEDGRPSSEAAERDHRILDEEDERERLLAREGGSGRFPRLFNGGEPSGDKVKIGKRERRKLKREARRGRKHGRRGEASELMYEMEEGGRSSESESLRNSSESDQQRLGAILGQNALRRARIWRRIIIHIAIVILFVSILAIAYRASKRSRGNKAVTHFFNGTSNFAATTILISLDGFRADFLYRGLTPTLNRFVQEGISPKYMLPSFPSVTFPNHYTMVTGLYPEAHGIVGNTFWDPNLQKEFYYTDPNRSLQPHWWGGEPLWVTAEKQNVRTAIHMWPGSEAHIGGIEPAHVDKYNGSEVLPLKVDRIFQLLDLPGPESPAARANLPRPQLIAAYVPVVDSDGHMYGPNSTEIRQTISNVDTMLGDILHGLQERNLTDIVNVVVVSDHGMATTDVDRLIQLEDLVNPDELEHVDGWPLYGLRPKNPDDLERLYQQLLEKAKGNPNIEVYLRDKDMPERYHFSQNPRIAPLWIVPKTGWAIVTKDEFDVEEGKRNGDVYHPRGLHGYDFEHPLMRAIFVARGPAFPHKPGSRVEPFQNIELYNIVCDSVGVTPKPNNGTLRLPLKPVGLHSDPDAPTDETPSDPVESAASILPSSSISLSSAVSTVLSSSSIINSPYSNSISNLPSGTVDSLSSTSPSTIVPTSSAPTASSAPDNKEQKKPWWEWVTDKVEEVKEWVDEIIHAHDAKPANGGHPG
ncbi:Phosphodiest-domain-containing protein [Glonium stellatum]|uniref:Phosphodiest-domain-containing protein n=1 Tax=Glonium stellatum TaxID=574774 RepID=A0A8E2EVS1_9PEZI|nr:Phosphodiest-domain-containing protein [Glonium stellatum]